MSHLPQRKKLPHEVPAWVPDGAAYFITICTRPRGVNQLCRSPVAEWLRESMEYRKDRGDWWVHLAVLMPDHLHALMSFAREKELNAAIAQWKRYAARETGIQWQADYFEHRLRNDENFQEKACYIRMNPVRAGLIDDPEKWPFKWSYAR